MTIVPPPPPHRKRVKHIEVPHQCRMFTFSCCQRRPILLEGDRPRLLGQSVTRAASKLGWLLHAFVLMPEHVHLVLRPVREECTAPALLKAIKRPMSFRVKQELAARRDPLLEELTILERPGKTTFRFWQEGPGHDANLRDRESIVNAIRYMHFNPVKRGLCAAPDDWPWSSARQYHNLEPLSVWTPRVTMWDWRTGGVGEGDRH